jgi:hypothetical protein
MKWSFDVPLTLQLGPKPALGITQHRIGVAEATLSDGRKVHVMFDLTEVKVGAEGNHLEFSYQILPEVIDVREYIHPAHETRQ